MKVYGFDEENVYEFHGFPKCFPYSREAPLNEDPSDNLHLRYERTKSKMAKLGEKRY